MRSELHQFIWLLPKKMKPSWALRICVMATQGFFDFVVLGHTILSSLRQSQNYGDYMMTYKSVFARKAMSISRIAWVWGIDTDIEVSISPSPISSKRCVNPFSMRHLPNQTDVNWKVEVKNWRRGFITCSHVHEIKMSRRKTTLWRRPQNKLSLILWKYAQCEVCKVCEITASQNLVVAPTCGAAVASGHV